MMWSAAALLSLFKPRQSPPFTALLEPAARAAAFLFTSLFLYFVTSFRLFPTNQNPPTNKTKAKLNNQYGGAIPIDRNTKTYPTATSKAGTKIM